VRRANRCEQPSPRFGELTRHRRFGVLCAIAAVGCAKPAAKDRAFDDPAQAAAIVRATVTSCAGVGQTLDDLARARVSGRVLAGLVDDAIAHARCDDLGGAIRGRTAAHQLARARLADDRPDDALAQLTTLAEPAIRYRRAELLDRLGRSGEAHRELAAVTLDDEAKALQRLLRVSIAARAGHAQEVVHAVGAAPLAERPRLASRAVADAPLASLPALVDASGASALDVAMTAADRLEERHGPAAVLAARERIAALDGGDADAWDALGRARIAAGNIDDALAAWDRAIALAPAQPAFRLTPIRALVIAEQPARATQRAAELARQARAGSDVELIVTASAAAAAAGDGKLALELARDARARRAGDGRLAFLVAQRLAEAGDARGAAVAYSELLVCGAHGRPWHRHEVAGELLALARGDDTARRIVLAALAAKRACQPVEPEDLATYVEGLRAR
jgi:cytochrome c-type biogenesis protein CcmH/NrfG